LAPPDQTRRRDAFARPFLRLWPRLWFMPIVGAVIAVGISVGTLVLDQELTDAGVSLPVVAAAPGQIATLFSVIAASILNLLALVFTILIVVLQLTSSQYSHRALRTLLQDAQSRVTLGVFVATFMHALIVLASLGTAEDDDRIAGVSVTSKLVLSIISIATFLFFIDHITRAIRVTSIIDAIARETRGMIDRIYRDEAVAPTEQPALPRRREAGVVSAADSGVVASVDVAGLMEAARRVGALVELVPAIGDFVPRGAPLLLVHGGTDISRASTDGRPPPDLARFVTLGTERTPEDDVAFGFRQLVDVAERALSPGTNDPTIAVHAVNHMHDLLRTLVTRDLPNGVYADADGSARLIVPRPTWGEYVSLATDEVRHYGAESIQVTRRLRAMLEDLVEVAPDARQAPLRRQLALLDASIERHYPDDEERSIARQPDPQGHGSPRLSGSATRFARSPR
jgi:uncharacterized membrane protein